MSVLNEVRVELAEDIIGQAKSLRTALLQGRREEALELLPVLYEELGAYSRQFGRLEDEAVRWYLDNIFSPYLWQPAGSWNPAHLRDLMEAAVEQFISTQAMEARAESWLLKREAARNTPPPAYHEGMQVLEGLNRQHSELKAELAELAPLRKTRAGAKVWETKNTELSQLTTRRDSLEKQTTKLRDQLIPELARELGEIISDMPVSIEPGQALRELLRHRNQAIYTIANPESGAAPADATTETATSRPAHYKGNREGPKAARPKEG